MIKIINIRKCYLKFYKIHIINKIYKHIYLIGKKIKKAKYRKEIRRNSYNFKYQK